MPHTTSIAAFTAVAVVSLVAAPSAFAQITEYDFVIDGDASSIEVSGSVQGFGLGGDRTTNIGGMIMTRVGDPVPPFRGFIIDESLFEQLDGLNVTIKNPIPFFPPLGRVKVDNLAFNLSTGIIRVDDVTGAFASTSGVVEFISGTVDVEILGSPVANEDLTGQIVPGIPVEGFLVQEGDNVVLDFPFELVLEEPDFNITVTGGTIATAPVKQ